MNEIERLKSMFPRASQAFFDANADPQLQSPKPKRHKTPALGDATEGKETCVGRVTVRFIGYRCRPLDPDNFAGGCKDLLDGLRHAGLIPNDRPQDIIFETEQVKVGTRGEERTQIVLEYL